MERVEKGRAAAPAEGAGRTPSDVATLLVELGRVVKARQFYAASDPALAEFVDRGFRTFRAELERHGQLELAVSPDGFRLLPDGGPIGRARLEDVARVLVQRGVEQLRLDPELDAAGFSALVEALGAEGTAALPSVPAKGVAVNGGAAPERPASRPAAAPAAAPTPAPSPTPEAPPAPRAAAPPAARTDDKRRLDLDRAPLEAPPTDERGAHLVALLRELDACRDDARHAELARQLATDGAAAFEAGARDECYRVMRVLGMHAADSGRSDAQRRAAAERLAELASGLRLEALIVRACGRGPDASIRASQLLLQIGAKVVPTLLQRIEAEQDADRRGQMSGILIAMGEKATPDLLRWINGADLRRARTAARFAGEVQNPAAIPDLRRLLQQSDAELRREAAKALVRIGHPSAIEALTEALSRRDRALQSLAAYCLGATSSPRAFEALREALPRALWRSDFELAREIIRALARIGRPEAVAALVPVLARRSLFQRRALREVKVAAIDALAKLPGDPALRALAAAGEARDPAVRDVARRALSRRSSPAAA